MKYTKRFTLVLILLFAHTSTSAPFAQPDWPQWHGPDRNAISTETGLLKTWPAAGPQVVWSISGLGEGYGSLAIKGDRIYVQGVKDSQSSVFALNRADGRTVWVTPLGPRLGQDKGPGPRGTPTVENDRLYALAESGDLGCLKASDGSVVWRRNILKDFGGRNPKWLISESPLIDGDRLIVTPGGQGASIVALDKATGKTIWTTKELSDEAAYSSCVAADIGGVRTIVGFTGQAGVGVRASDGKLMWRYERVSNDTANIATPIVHDNKVFYTSDYGTGCALLGLKAEGGQVKAEEIYFSRDMMNHHGGVVLLDGYLYGFNNAILELRRVRDRQGGLARPQRRQRDVNLCRWAALPAGREQCGRIGRRVAGRLQGEGPLPDRRSGVAELGASGRVRWEVLHTQSGNARLLRHKSKVAEWRYGAQTAPHTQLQPGCERIDESGRFRSSAFRRAIPRALAACA